MDPELGATRSEDPDAIHAACSTRNAALAYQSQV